MLKPSMAVLADDHIALARIGSVSATPHPFISIKRLELADELHIPHRICSQCMTHSPLAKPQLLNVPVNEHTKTYILIRLDAGVALFGHHRCRLLVIGEIGYTPGTPGPHKN